jgi:hydroxyacylglutathione hydrolase
MIHIRQFRCLDDNYGYLVHDDVSGETATIDTPDADAILAEAAAAGWRITQIWNTHWHPDHAGGNAAIKSKTGATVIGPAEVSRLTETPDRVLVEGDVARLGAHAARVLDVGGHTLGHIAYVFDADRVAFVGDALFTMGCGKLFEGTPQQMWTSLSKLAALPDETVVYCAHEYTKGNATFALSIDGENAVLRARADDVFAKTKAGIPTVPTTIGEEKATNPFLRAPLLKGALDMAEAEDWQAFGELRRRKG